MDIDLAALPDDVDALQRMVRTLVTERVNLTEAQAEIERLRLIVQKLQTKPAGASAPRGNPARSRASSVPLLRRPTACGRRDCQRDARSCARQASCHPHLPAALWLPGLRDESIRRPPRSVRSPRASPVPVFLLTSWSPNTAITFRYTGRARSLPGTALRSTARPWRTGWAALVSGWSRCRPASQRMCLDQPSCLPTTRRSRCSIPAAAAPRSAGCGSMRATIDPGPGPNRRPPSTSTVLIARQSVLPVISRTSVVCCKSTAMLASSG
jgi:hypothetical protein